MIINGKKVIMKSSSELSRLTTWVAKCIKEFPEYSQGIRANFYVEVEIEGLPNSIHLTECIISQEHPYIARTGRYITESIISKLFEQEFNLDKIVVKIISSNLNLMTIYGRSMIVVSKETDCGYEYILIDKEF